MKKIILKKRDDVFPKKRIGYKIQYENDLNPAQYEAVMHDEGAALVIAGAGTGKTRTLIYRLSRLVEDGIAPESILLLTFTRKSSAEMLRRAAIMLDGRCELVSGGTFHSFALQVLRRWAKLINYESSFNVLDQGDIEDTINLLRSHNKFDKTKKRFPRKDTLSKIFNLTINRCQPIEDIVLKDYPYFFDEIDGIVKIFEEYNSYKRKYNLMDYDDILLNLQLLCSEHQNVRFQLNEKYRYVLVDEYQDTNKLQHEIVLSLAGKNQNVMAVGDDAQSIYSFRGAEFQNIMTFPDSFENCKVYKIEENYRSTQQILNLTNFIIEGAAFKYSKELFSLKTEGELPKIITAKNEKQQSEFLVQQILELREEGIDLEDIAVLFRSGFLSFDLEIELNRANIPYKKFGGMKFIETAHIKDILAYFKILYNDRDAVSWNRVLLLLDGVGPRTSTKIVEMITSGQISPDKRPELNYTLKSNVSILGLLALIKDLNEIKLPIGEKAARIVDYYKPILKNRYDDWQKRSKDIETFLAIAERYKSINDLLNDMAIEPPIESIADIEAESKEEEFLTLSTIHSAKGLEWKAVFIIWALDGRFPSAKAADSIESLEEERRLFYVASTRAKERLYITYPINIFDRFEGTVLSKPTRFLDGVTESIAEFYMLQDWDVSEN
jgi:DNA helicase II / ATP-dependent DNA helicase PcrA